MRNKPNQPKQLPKTKYFRLEWREDQHGIRGWILHDMPMFDVGSGMTLAHDLLEHFEHKTDDMASEYMAFGCIVWGRLDHYWDSFVGRNGGRRTTPRDLGTELANFYRDLHERDTLTEPPEWTRGPVEMDLADTYSDMADGLLETLITEMDQDDDETDEEFRDRMSDAAARIMGWVQAGYIMAELTWGQITTPFYFTNWFYNIERAIEDEFGHGEEGEALSITLDYRTMRASLRAGRIDEYTGRINYTGYPETIHA